MKSASTCCTELHVPSYALATDNARPLACSVSDFLEAQSEVNTPR